MDWNQVLGWGSPIGLGVFLFGFGKFLRATGSNWYARHSK